MAAPLDDYADLLGERERAAPYATIFDDAAVTAAVTATALRAVVVHGPPGSGRAHVTRTVCGALEAAGRRYVVDDTRKYATQGESARRSIAAHLRETRSLVLVIVYTRPVKSEDALSIHTVAFVDDAALRDQYALSRRAFIRTFHGSITDVRTVCEYKLPMPVRDAAHNSGRCAIQTLDPDCAVALERIFQHETRRKPAAIANTDAFSDADILIARHALHDVPMRGMFVAFVRAYIDSRYPGKADAAHDGNRDRD
jgi:hypothetical protein